jgi:hypothetical protein
LGQLLEDIGNADPDDADLADLRSLLYGLLDIEIRIIDPEGGPRQARG